MKPSERLALALKPLARLDIDLVRAYDGAPDDRRIFQLNETYITLGDVRRARRLLERYPPPKESRRVERKPDTERPRKVRRARS